MSVAELDAVSLFCCHVPLSHISMMIPRRVVQWLDLAQTLEFWHILVV